jgi:hypothetical protein
MSKDRAVSAGFSEALNLWSEPWNLFVNPLYKPPYILIKYIEIVGIETNIEGDKSYLRFSD